MSFLTGIKANKAYRLQRNGNKEEALRLYEECFAEGLDDPRYNLAYALLIIRDGQYQKAKDFLVKHQKAPGMTQDQRTNLLVDYAVCCFRLGDLDKGINTLEQQFRKTETGILYQTLGYLYVEKYDRANRPDFEAMKAAKAEADAASKDAEAGAAGAPEMAGEAAGAAKSETEGAGTAVQGAEAAESTAREGTSPAEAAKEPPASPEEAWEAGKKKAEEFLEKAVDYDDEDAICLDNMGQFLYRVKGDREAAKRYFEKALKIKDSQIDTLVFLSRYDEEAGDTRAALEKLEKALGGRFSPLNFWSKAQVEQEIARLKGD